VFSVFTSSLPSCSLKSIRCDVNDLTYAAYVTLYRSLSKSEHLEHIDFPMEDYVASESRLKPKYLDILIQISQTLSTRQVPGKALWRPNPFTFDLKWKTPENINPLVPVPPELQSISSKFYDGALPSLPNENDIVIPPRSASYITPDEDSSRPKKRPQTAVNSTKKKIQQLH